jgi:pantetheine-phosphate adenylyltransferase
MRTAVYPGTFDPITLGHYDIAKRAAKLFDQVIFAVANDPSGKRTTFSLQQRVELAEEVFSEHDQIIVCQFSGLVAEYCAQRSADALIRGIRTVADFEYEFQIAYMNSKLNPNLESVFLAPSEQLSFISSTIVKEVASLGGNIDEFVHPVVAKALINQFK